MGLIHYNLFRTTLNGGINSSTTSITLTDSLPTTLAAGEFVYLTIVAGALNEMIKIDSSTGAPAYTGCTRAQQGSTAQAWSSGARVECRITRDSVDTKQESLSSLVPTAVTPATGDYLLMKDTSDSGNLKRTLVSDVLDLSTPKFTLLDTQTASTSASLNFTGISGNYSELRFVFNHLILSAGGTAGFFMRTSTDNGVNYASASGDYGYTVYAIGQTSGQIMSSSSVTTRIRMINDDSGAGAYRTQAGNSISGRLSLYDPANATVNKQVTYELSYGSSASDNVHCRAFGGGTRRSTADIDAVRFATDSGTITSGVIYMYGVKI